MGILLDRARERRAKKAGDTPVMPVGQETERPNEELSVTTLETPAPPVSQPAETAGYAPNEELSMSDMNAPAPPETKAAGTSVTTQPASTYTAPSWINAGSYEKAAQMDPNISRAQYAYELSRYRREQGLPDLGYDEWGLIINGQDPYETAAERQRRERNMRIAKQINAVGTFLNALVNYHRVKRGHVGYTPNDGSEGYNRLERIRQGQEALARSNAKDYLGMIAQDRAERAKAEAAAAAAERDARDYQLKVEELKWKIENARTEAGRKKAQDELNKLKFEEQQRHNKAMEGAAWTRANKEGSSGKIATSAMSADGRVWTRSSPLSKEEAMQLVMGSEYGKDKSFLDNFRSTVTTLGEDGETIRKGEVNWFEAAASLMAGKKIPAALLSEMGYKGEYTDVPKTKPKQVEGFASGSPNGAKTVSGFGSQ